MMPRLDFYARNVYFTDMTTTDRKRRGRRIVMRRRFYRRHLLRLYAKIVREKASPEYIARGWAIGMFYG